MSVVKNISRNIIFPVFNAIGGNAIVRQLSNNNMLILCLHGVTNSNVGCINGRHMLASDFEKLCKYLSINFDVKSVAEVFEMYQNNYKPKRKTIAITFDDGYLNNLKVAAPILQAYNLKASFYIVSSTLNNPEYNVWPDIIDVLFAKSDNKVFKFGNDNFEKKDGTLVNITTNETAYNFFRKTGDDRLEIFNQVIADYKVSNLMNTVNAEFTKMVSDKNVLELASNSLFEIGSHTVNHFCLANINEELVKSEVTNSKNELENLLQKKIVSIAFPDGSYNTNVLNICKNQGYTHMLLVDYKTEKDKENKDILPRLSVSNTTNFYANAFHISKAFGSDGF